MNDPLHDRLDQLGTQFRAHARPSDLPGAVTLQRLTRRQYANALGALFGSAARLPTDLDVDKIDTSHSWQR